jgi:polysaccharide export outer membrane protein
LQLTDTPVAKPKPSKPRTRKKPGSPGVQAQPYSDWEGSSLSFRALSAALFRRWGFVASLVGGLSIACILYCLIAPDEYEASARIALRSSPATALNLDGTPGGNSNAFGSEQTQLETLAGVFRSERSAWAVIIDQSLYRAPGFAGRFAREFPGFQANIPEPEAQAYLLERFQKRLNVRTLPRTLILQIRFRSSDPALAAAVVNGLIRLYNQQETAERLRTTEEATASLSDQLKALKSHVATEDERLVEFQRQHGLLNTPEILANGQPGEAQHNPALAEVDDLGRELDAATAERTLRDAEYRAAQRGNPELVMASDLRLQAETPSFPSALLQQLRTHRSELQQEESQLSTEHGPNFPRVVEIRAQLHDLDKQIAAEDAQLLQRFQEAWKTAVDREQLLRRSLAKSTAEGMKLNAAAFQYAAIRQEANASHELYARIEEKVEEAGLTAAIRSPNIEVVDYARQPVKPVAPDLPVYLAITVFVGLWLAIGGVLLLESRNPSALRAIMLMLALPLASGMGRAQAPTPSTSGLPAGVAHIPQSTETKSHPNAKEAPAVWSDAANRDAFPPNGPTPFSIHAPIGPGDIVAVSEFHTPDFHTTARVAEDGTLTLPLVGDVQVNGMDDRAAERAIESALVNSGMLLHPQVTVLVTEYAGLDVSVLGAVVRPGVYPFATHHRLLDLISAASGLAPAAGDLVTITHRSDERAPFAIVLNPSAGGAAAVRNPELEPGDTVEVSRAGLVYVVGDVMRPGGFPVDPVEHPTVVQALTLAWGPTQSAALTKALLIREQAGGRTVTLLNLKRLLRGEDPDLPIQDRDILFVPDSTAKNLWNRTMESVVQSAAGVSIYAGLVYSQRF